MKPRFTHGAVGIGLYAALASATATAQTAPPSDTDPTQSGPRSGERTFYEAAYFQRFAPSTALDIVRRVPGFSMESGNSDVRGFGGAAGNVVINGARPTSKSESIDTILSRIPASRVTRVEIGSGDLFGSEFAGRAQVVNVVLNSAGGLSGTASAALQRAFTGQVSPSGSLSVLTKRGESTFNLAGAFDRFRFPERGTDVVTRIATGERLELREKFNDGREQGGSLSGSWAHEAGENRTAHLNFRVADNHFKLNQDNDVFPLSGPVRDDRLSQDSKARDYEVGGDVTRPLWGGGVKLIGLATRRHRDSSDVSLNRVGGGVIGGFAQSSDNQRNETVARLLWSRGNLRGWSVEVGAEGALNSLDSDVQLFGIGEGGARTRIDLPVDQAKVEEYRGEAFVNAGRKLAPNLRVDAGLTFEASRLTVTGDTEAERSLRFLKPSLTLDWRPGRSWHAQLSVKRTVAQLDFNDFISAAELTNDRIDAGNAELLPQRAWVTLLTIDRPILKDGTAKLELGYDHISLLQDRVPTPEGFDAPGNLGMGRKAFANLTIDAPLGGFGIKGGRLNFNVLGQRTAVRDPYTGEDRRFSGALHWDFNLNYRQDLGRYAYGLGYYAQPRRPFFRRNEIDEPNSGERRVNVFAEYRPTASSTLTLSVDNVLNNPFRRFRTFFDPDRSNPVPVIFEARERFQPRSMLLRYKHNFG
ncbi:MAG TPA: TonB-dependent receptor plug domain-containing protein [Sphingomonadaceae bacterium]|nr:TonB-dependent receptor plug domain-containing protein [Sphingomonadaceae bacterium]